MKTKTILVVILFLILCWQGYAQENDSTHNKIFYFQKFSKFQLEGIYTHTIFKDSSENMKALAFFNDYLIKPKDYWAFGAGCGLKIYEKQILIPVYADLVFCPGKHFFLNTQTGYSFGWKRKSNHYPEYTFKGGFTGTIGIGYKLKFNNDFNSCIQLSYNYQKTKLNSQTLPSSVGNFHSVMLSFGLLLDRK